MNLSLDELCQLWRLQNNECRVTQMLKQKINDYDNNNPFNHSKAIQERKHWAYEMKFQKETLIDPLEVLKEQYFSEKFVPQKQLESLYEIESQYEFEQIPFHEKSQLLKTYTDTLKENLQPNIIDFQKYFWQPTETTEQQPRKPIEYFGIFYKKFQQILQNNEQENSSKTLLLILETISQNDKDSDIELKQKLSKMVLQQSGLKYLIRFRSQINNFLETSQLLKYKQNILQHIHMSKNKKNKNINTNQQIQLTNFVQLKSQQLQSQIYHIQRTNNQNQIKFKLKPILNPLKIQAIKIYEIIPSKYLHYFQNDLLNHIQSQTFQQLYHTKKNVFVCAPGGTGKFNLVIIAVLSEIKEIKKVGNFHIIYVVSSKKSVGNVVEKLSTKFPQFYIHQLTGQASLSQQELNKSNILVVTIEKLDLITRKSLEIIQRTNLIIFEEISCLHGQNGWMIQNVVSKIKKIRINKKKNIRIFALSSPISNYQDISEFLEVEKKCVFVFGPNDRPVQLSLNVLGLKMPKNILSSKLAEISIKNEKVYDLSIFHIKNGRQIIVFVESRKQAINYCEWMISHSKFKKDEYLLKHQNLQEQYIVIRDQNLLAILKGNFGIGYYLASMQRSDRNILQKMFINQQIKVLIVPSTEAWSLNISSQIVILKGAQIGDGSEQFGRLLTTTQIQNILNCTGRLKIDQKCQTTIITQFSKVNYHLHMLMFNGIVQSGLLQHLKEVINAEIASDIQITQKSLLEFIKRMFINVRIKKCPETYGCQKGANEKENQNISHEFLRKKICEILDELLNTQLIKMEQGNITSTELGRLACRYYLKCETIAHVCHQLQIYTTQSKQKSVKTELQILTILSKCKQFSSIKIRRDQVAELKFLRENWFLTEKPTEQTFTHSQKVILLIQGYIKGANYSSSNLIKETKYIIKNSINILRCMLDLCLKRAQAANFLLILNLCKFLQNRIYRNESPLKQFTKISYSGFNFSRMKKREQGYLKKELYDHFNNLGLQIGEYLAEDNRKRAILLKVAEKDISKFKDLQKFCQYMPFVSVSYITKPLSKSLMQIVITLKPTFAFDAKWHNKEQNFWIILDDYEDIIHSEIVSITQQFIQRLKQINICFCFKRKVYLQENYRITVTSDRWVTDQREDLQIKILPFTIQKTPAFWTKLLNLQPLPINALKNPLFESIYENMTNFNRFQTQVFFNLYNSSKNILIGAPSGSGKTIMCQLSILNLFKMNPNKKCIYIASNKQSLYHKSHIWSRRFNKLKKSVSQLTSDFVMNLNIFRKADIIVGTAMELNSIWGTRLRQEFDQIGLIIFDDLHVINSKNGEDLQIILSRINQLRTNTKNKLRTVGLGVFGNCFKQFQEWFAIGSYTGFNFEGHLKDLHVMGFNEKQYSLRMESMNRPVSTYIQSNINNTTTLIFVPSRKQIRLTIQSLLSSPQYFPIISQKTLFPINQIQDNYLKEIICHGIALWHLNLEQSDLQICEQMFLQGKIKVFIICFEIAWRVWFRANLVVVKGTQYFDCNSNKYIYLQLNELTHMINRAGVPDIRKGTSIVCVQNSKKSLYKKVLQTPLPIQSNLLWNIQNFINVEIAIGEISNESQCYEWISWTFLFRRILKNPQYYGLLTSNTQEIKSFLISMVSNIFNKLQNYKCIQIQEESDSISPTILGQISSNYSIKPQTLKKLHHTIRPGIQLKELLKIICETEQLKQIQVRYSEQKSIQKISQIAPFQAGRFNLPQNKVFLLAQMHFYHLPCPLKIFQYDSQNAIQRIRKVALALMDIVKEKGRFDTMRDLIYIQQISYQGVGCNIPSIEHKTWKVIDAKFGGLSGIVQALGRGEQSKQFVDILKFINIHIPNLSNQQRRKIVQAFKSLPRIKFSAKALRLNISKQKTGLKESKILFTIEIMKQNSQISNCLILQKKAQVKYITWWIVIADSENKIIAIKRVLFNKKVIIRFQVTITDKSSSTKTFAYLMSDCYIGLDQVQEIYMPY